MVSCSNVFLSPSPRLINRVGTLVIGLLLTGEVVGENERFPPSTDFPEALSMGNETGDTLLYLELILNQVRQSGLLPVIQRGSEFFVRLSDLQHMGFVLDTDTGTDPVALSSLPGLEIHYLLNSQQLQLDAPLSLLDLPITKRWAGSSQLSPEASASPGALLNYDVYFNREGDNRLASAATEFRIFGIGRGVFSHTTMTRAQRSEESDWHSEAVALDTFGEWSFPDNATRLILGDAISGRLNWSRPLRLGGIHFGRHFGLQPYRTTSPLASFAGQATLPSSVELYIDGMRRYQSEVPAGPFELNAVPGITGAGQAQVVTTDILGRTTTLNIPFYNSQRLLAEGLSDWSLNLGVVHEDYGLRSFVYDDELVATGSLRYGLNNHLTLEGHAETGGRLVNGGMGAVWQPGMAGVVSLAHTRSHENGDSGHQTAWRYSWSNRYLNVSVASQRTYGEFRDVASHYGTLPPKVSEQILTGVHLPMLGNIGVSGTRFEEANSDEEASRYAGIYWSNSVGNGIFLNLSYNQNLNEREDRYFQFGIHISFDHQYQLSSSMRRRADRESFRTSLQRSLPSDGGYGWRLQGEHNDEHNNGSAEGSWQGNYGRIDAGVARIGEQRSSYAQASGGLVWMNGQGFASRRINDSFAVVSTSGIPDVPVKLENRVIGTTNDSGSLLVTRLNAWQRNKLSIDPMNLPADNKVTLIDQITTPSDRAGTLVQFAVEKVRAAVVILTDIHGQPLPVSSRVRRMHHAGSDMFVGFDGETYLEDLQDHNQLQVDMPDRTCLASFDYPKGKTPSHYIGPIPCLEEDRSP